MILSAMQTALQRIAGVDAADPLTDWINDALHEFEDAYDWPFLETLTTIHTVSGGTTFSDLPGDLGKVVNIKVLSSPTLGSVARPTLKYVSRVQFQDESRYDPTSTGEPCVYTLVGNTTPQVWPITDAIYTYQLLYIKALPDLVNPGDSPAMPSKYHYTVVRGAVATALEAESEEDRAATAQNAFENAIQRHLSKIGGRKQSGSMSTVRDVMGYGHH